MNAIARVTRSITAGTELDDGSSRERSRSRGGFRARFSRRANARAGQLSDEYDNVSRFREPPRCGSTAIVTQAIFDGARRFQRSSSRRFMSVRASGSVDVARRPAASSRWPRLHGGGRSLAEFTIGAHPRRTLRACHLHTHRGSRRVHDPAFRAHFPGSAESASGSGKSRISSSTVRVDDPPIPIVKRGAIGTVSLRAREFKVGYSAAHLLSVCLRFSVAACAIPRQRAVAIGGSVEKTRTRISLRKGGRGFAGPLLSGLAAFARGQTADGRSSATRRFAIVPHQDFRSSARVRGPTAFR